MRIRWTVGASDDLQHIKKYLTEHHPAFVEATIFELYETIRSLRSSPYRGRIGRIEGTRELIFARLPYVVAYRVRAQAIEILHIYHGAQQRP